MSRFFAAGASSSDSEENTSSDEFVEVKEAKHGLFEALSFSEGDEETEEESFMGEEGEEEETPTLTAPARKSRFTFDTDSESEEDSTQRQVKSQKEKAQEEMESLVEAIEGGLEGKDWPLVQENYERIVKMITKYQDVCVPNVAYLMFLTLERELNNFSTNPELKKLKADTAKTFNALRQKVRKALNTFGEQIERAQKATIEQEEEEEGEEEEGGEDSVSLTKKDTSNSKQGTMEVLKTVELTTENLLKRLQEIISTRGRKHVDKQENVGTLRRMISISKNQRHTLHALVALIATNLEISAGNLGYIPIEAFTSLLNDLSTMINLLKEEEEEGTVGSWVDLKADEEEAGLPAMTGVRGSMISYTQRLDDEFTRALQNIDPHSSEYVDFLRVEPQIFSLLGQCQSIVMKGDQIEFACQLAIRRLEHIYCKPQDIVTKFFGAQSSVLDLCRFLYKNAATERQKARALLYHVYWLAIHDNYQRARDLMLYSHIQDCLGSLDVSSQTLYNRVLVQVGLAAFRSGHFKETYFALQELCSTGRPKELLAQGLVGQKYTEKGEMDRVERQRLIPFHMQINVELIDCIFLTVSMLLELPQNAASNRRYFTGERRLFPSRHLRRILDAHDRNLFNGPPENTREYVVAAAKALANGNWRECERHMMTIKIWDLLPNPDAIKAMLKHKIRESGLYAFIYSMGSCYSTLSLEKLSRDYDLPLTLIVRIVNRLVKDYGMPAEVSEDEKCIIWRSDCEPSPIQERILQLSDKVSLLSERNNEANELLGSLHHSHARNLRNQENMNDNHNNNNSSNTNNNSPMMATMSVA